MFGIGMSELLVILVVALLFLGPEKLPDAAKKLSQGIREFRQQGRELQRTIQDDTELGAAVRDLKSALRGDDFHPVPYRQDPKSKGESAGDPKQQPGDPDSQPDPAGEPPADPDPYGLADPPQAEQAADGGDPESETATATQPASPAPAAVPVEVQSSRRGAGTGDPDGAARS